MFNIIPLKEVLLNVKNSENLFRLFHRRTRKASKDIKQPSLSSTIHNIFVLPSHILVLLEGEKLELLAYDQVPNLDQHASEVTDLLSQSPNRTTSVLDVFVHWQNADEYVLIATKAGELIVWSYRRPAFQWRYETTLSLCKAKGSQLVSYAYNPQNKNLVWCEKWALKICTVTSAQLMLKDEQIEYFLHEREPEAPYRKYQSDTQGVSLENTQSILHNALPVNIYLVGNSSMCFVANVPPALMLFWHCYSNTITLHMWGDSFNAKSIPTSKTDYQDIVKSSVALWFDATLSERKFISLTTHPTTNELVALQQDLQLHLIRVDPTGRVNSIHLCTLETQETEIFSKQVTGTYLLNNMLLVLMSDGRLNVFDVKYGLFLWKTESFEGTAPKVWLRKGPFPTAGVWDKTGIWHLRSKEVPVQLKEHTAEEMQNASSGTSTSTKEKQQPTVIIDGKMVRRRARVYKGISRNARIPLHYPFQILSNWSLGKRATELALEETMKIKEDLQLMKVDDILCLLKQIDDPVLILALFAGEDFPYAVRRKAVAKLKSQLTPDALETTEESYLPLLRNFLEAENEIEECLDTLKQLNEKVPVQDDTTDLTTSIFLEEFENLALIPAEQINETLVHLFTFDKNLTFTYLLNLILPEYLKEANHRLYNANILLKFEKLRERVIDTIFSLRNSSCDLLITEVWREDPSLILPLLQASPIDLPTYKTAFVKKILDFIRLPPSLADGNKDRVTIYCNLLLQHNDQGFEECCRIYLHYNCIEKAVAMLHAVERNSNQHRSAFFHMLVHLLKANTLKYYIHVLGDCIPHGFNLVQFNALYGKHACNMSQEQVFAANALDIKSMKPMLSLLMNN